MLSSHTTSHAARRRRPVLAVFLSGIFPGLGQFYNHQSRKGALFLIGGALTGFGPLRFGDVDVDLDDPTMALKRMLIATLPFLIVALWSVIDAYRVAKTSARD